MIEPITATILALASLSSPNVQTMASSPILCQQSLEDQIQSAKARYERSRQLAETGAISQLDLLDAEVEYQTLVQKRDRALAGREDVQSARERYERLRILEQTGAIPRIEVETAKAQYQQLLRAQTQSSLDAKVQAAKLDYERVQQLYTQGAVSYSAVVQAESIYQKLRAERDRLK